MVGSILAALCIQPALAASSDHLTDAQCEAFQDKFLELAGRPVFDTADRYRYKTPVTRDLIAFLQRYDWLLHEAQPGRRKQLLMEADGFRTRNARFFSCFYRPTPSSAGDCIVSVVREDDKVLTEQPDMVVVLELLGPQECSSR